MSCLQAHGHTVHSLTGFAMMSGRRVHRRKQSNPTVFLVWLPAGLLQKRDSNADRSTQAAILSTSSTAIGILTAVIIVVQSSVTVARARSTSSFAAFVVRVLARRRFHESCWVNKYSTSAFESENINTFEIFPSVEGVAQP